MKNITEDLFRDIFNQSKSQSPLGEADKAIKKIQELNEKIQKNQKEIARLKTQLVAKAPEPSPIGKRVDRILSILNRLESQGSMSMEDIRGLRVQVEGLK